MKQCILLALLGIFIILITGCGETISGMGKDINRIGKGVKTVFVRE